MNLPKIFPSYHTSNEDCDLIKPQNCITCYVLITRSPSFYTEHNAAPYLTNCIGHSISPEPMYLGSARLAFGTKYMLPTAIAVFLFPLPSPTNNSLNVHWW